MIELLTDEWCVSDIGCIIDAAPCTVSLLCINEMLDALKMVAFGCATAAFWCATAAFGCATTAFGCAVINVLDSALDPMLLDVVVADAFGLAPNAVFSLLVVLFNVTGFVFMVVQKLQAQKGLFLVDRGNDFCCETISL